MIEAPAQAPTPVPSLLLSQPVDTLPVVDDFRWNTFASEWAPAAALLWWLVLGLFGWFAWPLLFPLLGGLCDRGYGLARVIGWLLVGWVHWLGTSLGLWENRVSVIAGLVGVLVLLGLLAWYRQRGEIGVFLRARRSLLLGEEALFACAFLAFVGVRLLDPDLWQPWNGGEKFMEFAFLNATLRSAHFPPYDPYFAGGTINYYYFGLYLVSMLIKLTGIVPEVAFNLAVPGLFALTATAIFSIGYSLAGPGQAAPSSGEDHAAADGDPASAKAAGTAPVRPVVVALLAVLFALLMGNLEGFWQIVRNVAALAGDGGSFLAGIGRLLHGAHLPGYDYWGPSRVIPFTINEFPYWTFLFADMHPHLIAMPIGMLVAGLALNQVGGPILNHRFSLTQDFAKLLLFIIVLGALGATNTWDLPVYALLVGGTFWLAAWRWASRRALILAPILAVAVVALAVLAYWPFYAHYRVGVGGTGADILTRYLAPVHEGSPLGSWLLVWGFFVLMAYGVTLVGDGPGREPSEGEDGPDPAPPLLHPSVVIAGIFGLALLLLLGVLGRPAAALVALPATLAFAAMLSRRLDPAHAFAQLLLVMGLAILGGIELIYLRDFLEGGDWYRMNTVFKFGMPAWLFLSLAGAALLPRAWQALDRRPEWLAVPWQTLTALLLAAGMVFLVRGTPARVADRFPGPQPARDTLDGTAFMTVGRYDWPDAGDTIHLSYDYLAIHWLLDHVQGTPVVAEAPAGEYQVGDRSLSYDYYRAGGLRVASLTGLPTFLGQHQYEQRSGAQVAARAVIGQEFFLTTDVARTRNLIAELHVDYIYIGRLERTLFGEPSLAKFDTMVASGDLEVVYQNQEVTIYRVKSGG